MAVANDRLAALHDRLSAHVEDLVDSDAWKQFLAVAARFHRYSANNVLLLLSQMPSATRVAAYRRWQSLGRQVRRGEAGLAILAPWVPRARPLYDEEAQAAAADRYRLGEPPRLNEVNGTVDRALVRLSRFLSLVLRHKPERIGLSLDSGGWADVGDLLERSRATGVNLTRDELERIVAENDKRRFALSSDGTRIRANQGHSIPVDLGLVPVEPPELLYHGTARSSLDRVEREGLTAQLRQHVHLSPDQATAQAVGRRHGRPVILTVEAGRMARDGQQFYRSENGVWLTDRVPVRYLVFPDDAPQPTEAI